VDGTTTFVPGDDLGDDLGENEGQDAGTEEEEEQFKGIPTTCAVPLLQLASGKPPAASARSMTRTAAGDVELVASAGLRLLVGVGVQPQRQQALRRRFGWAALPWHLPAC